MAFLTSELDRSSAAFRTNSETSARLRDELRERTARAALGGPEKSRERHRSRGKLLPRERVARLLDEGSPFLEIGALAAEDMYDGACPGAGVIAGIGMVRGRLVVVVCNDATVKGGAYYPVTVKKHLRAQEIAAENKLPCVYLVDSGGAFLPLQDEVFPDRDHFGRIFYNQANLSARGIPQISAVLGSCTAGGAYVPAMSDETVIVRNQGTIFLGGPPLVKAAIGEEVTPEELGGGELHTLTSGVTDHLAENDEHALEIVRDIVATLPEQKTVAWDVVAAREPDLSVADLDGIIPADVNGSYDVREVIGRIVDGSEFHEFKKDYGTTLVTGFAHHRRPPRGDRGEQRHPLLRGRAQGRALHRAVRPARRAPGVPAEHHRLHGGPGRGGRWHCQERRQDGHRGGLHPGSQVHGGGGRLLRRRQLLHVRARVLPAVPVHVAQRPDLRDGRSAGGVGAVHGQEGPAGGRAASRWTRRSRSASKPPSVSSSSPRATRTTPRPGCGTTV